MSKNEENFEVTISSVDNESSVTLVTSIDGLSEKWLSEAMHSYEPTNQKYSTYLTDGQVPSDKLTPEYLNELAENAQTDLNKIQIINSIIRKQINKNDIIGKTVECIDTNINTAIRLSNICSQKKNEESNSLRAKKVIEDFNEKIGLRKLLRKGTVTTFAEGNYIMYLRHENGNYKVDYYPLGVCEISDYDVNGDPIVLLNVQELRSRLQKTYRKTRKQKPLFFKNIEEEIKATYPKEVYEAFISKETYAKLNTTYSGVIRLGELNRKYGLSPIFRSLEPLSMLETFDNSDRINSRAKAKKIIHQKMRREVMGTDFNKKGFEEMAYAHHNFMSAWKQPTVVVTTPPTVENILYVEPKIEFTDTKTVNNYRTRVLATLGIGFLMDSSGQSVSTSSITVAQLMRTINKISEQFEDVLQKWYKQVLVDNGLDVKYCPRINIIDSEVLDYELKRALAKDLYTVFNGSLTSSLNMIGFDIGEEKANRILENKDEFDSKIFYPRSTGYTHSEKQSPTNDGKSANNKEGGRPPATKETNKTEYDKNYNKGAR